jgi:hypothetical protein
MMDEPHRDDIRRLLKEFGVRADGAIVAHLARTDGGPDLHVRMTLEDLTDYGRTPPAEPLRLVVEGTVRR